LNPPCRGEIYRARRAVQAAPVLPVALTLALPVIADVPRTRLVRCAHIGAGEIHRAPIRLFPEWIAQE
jgi:hypothetical protein